MKAGLTEHGILSVGTIGSENSKETNMTGHSRRHVLRMGAASAGALVAPRFAIAQADNRPSITVAVQKVTNSNVLDVLREQSNVGERIFFSSLWEGLITKTGAEAWRLSRDWRLNGSGLMTRRSS